MLESNTTQELGRTEEVTRDAAWEQAFLAQLTDELADSVAAFAKKRAAWLNVSVRSAMWIASSPRRRDQFGRPRRDQFGRP